MRLTVARTGTWLLLASCAAEDTPYSATPSAFPRGTAAALPTTPAAPLSFVRECPNSPPVDRARCNVPVTCEYGNNVDSHCNTAALCDPYGGWTVTEAYAGCIDDCPSKFESIAESGTCDKVGSVCTYYEGTCGCVAAATDGGSSGRWTCVQPEAGCPARRPTVRSRCVKPMTCDYGSCAFDRALTFSCNGDEWSLAPDAGSDAGCLDRDR